MKRRILCIIFSLILSLTLIGCDNSSKPSLPTAEFIAGAPTGFGDSFTPPDIKQTAGAPIIGEISKQALPDDSISIAGAGFESEGFRAYVCGIGTDGKQKTLEAKYTIIDDSLMSLLIDKSFRFGIYGIYLENSVGTGNIKFVNLPDIWYVGQTSLTAGDSFDIFGENLTGGLKESKDAVKAYIVSEDEYCEAEIISADPYKVSVKIPAGLTDGESYEIRLHTGHGGALGFADATQKISYNNSDPDAFNGRVIDVSSYGINTKDLSIADDDSAAVKKALSDAKDGDILFFPSGVYYFNSSIEISKSVKIAGAGSENTFIYTGKQFSGSLFNVEISHVEFANLSFRHIRKNGKIISTFIGYTGDGFDSGIFSLYVHDCHFLQEVPTTAKFKYDPIQLTDTANVIIENNTFESCGSVWARNGKKISYKNNTVLSTMYSGSYYGQDTLHFTNVNNLEISGNTFYGRDYLKDKTQELKFNDMTAGRTVVIQGHSTNNYIAHNITRSAGLPGFNAGELVLYENRTPRLECNIASSDGDTVTLPSDIKFQANAGDIISIISGRGKGQYAFVKSISGKAIVLDKRFEVFPDTTSKILVSRNFANSAVYDNDFNGYKQYDTNGNEATTCIQVYGGMHNLFFTENIGKYLPEGVCISPFCKDASAKCVVYWSHFDRNHFSDTGVGIRYYLGPGSNKSVVGEFSVGVTIRGNNFDNTKRYKDTYGRGGNAIEMSYPASHYNYQPSAATAATGAWINGIIIENNSFKNSECADISFGHYSSNTVLRNNINLDTDKKLKLDHFAGDGYIEANY